MNREQKLARIARAKEHVRLGRLVAGCYMDADSSDGQVRGCSVGCDAADIQLMNGVDIEDLVDDDCHKIVADHDHTQEWVEHLREAVFDGLPADTSDWWHVELAECLPETDDWVPYYHRCCVVCLTESLSHRHRWHEPCKQVVVDAIEAVIELHRSESVDKAAWSAAEAAAKSARRVAQVAAWHARRVARSAVDSAGDSAATAATAAWAACQAATDPNGSTARYARQIVNATADSGAWASGWSSAFKRIADKLILEFARPK